MSIDQLFYRTFYLINYVIHNYLQEDLQMYHQIILFILITEWILTISAGLFVSFLPLFCWANIASKYIIFENCDRVKN